MLVKTNLKILYGYACITGTFKTRPLLLQEQNILWNTRTFHHLLKPFLPAVFEGGQTFSRHKFFTKRIRFKMNNMHHFLFWKIYFNGMVESVWSRWSIGFFTYVYIWGVLIVSVCMHTHAHILARCHITKSIDSVYQKSPKIIPYPLKDYITIFFFLQAFLIFEPRIHVHFSLSFSAKMSISIL